MAFQFKKHESIHAGALRIAGEQLSSAIDQLQDSENPERVHEARKRIKKLRALLKLIRPQLGKAYRQLNVQFRDMGRELSLQRDCESMLEAAARLKTKGLRKKQVRALTELQSHLQENLTQQKQLATNQRNPVAEGSILAAFKTALADVEYWQLKTTDKSSQWDGFLNTYRSGRQSLRTVLKQPQDEALHAFRKQAKYHWYHLQLIAPFFKKKLKTEHGRAKQLVETLRDDHDLVLLSNYLNNHAAEFSTDLTPLHELIQKQRQKLQKEAFQLAREIYHSKPQLLLKTLAADMQYSPK